MSAHPTNARPASERTRSSFARRAPAPSIVATALAAAAVLAALAGCGTAKRGEPVAGPFVPDGPEVAAGQVVFFRNCNECHPHGEAGVGPPLNNLKVPEPAIRLKVRKGVAGVMPTFPPEKISDAELDELIRYIKAFRKQGE